MGLVLALVLRRAPGISFFSCSRGFRSLYGRRHLRAGRGDERRPRAATGRLFQLENARQAGSSRCSGRRDFLHRAAQRYPGSVVMAPALEAEPRLVRRRGVYRSRPLCLHVRPTTHGVAHQRMVRRRHLGTDRQRHHQYHARRRRGRCHRRVPDARSRRDRCRHRCERPHRFLAYPDRRSPRAARSSRSPPWWPVRPSVVASSTRHSWVQ